MIVYVVMGEFSDWDDGSNWIDSIYLAESDAQKRCNELTKATVTRRG